MLDLGEILESMLVDLPIERSCWYIVVLGVCSPIQRQIALRKLALEWDELQNADVCRMCETY